MFDQKHPCVQVTQKFVNDNKNNSRLIISRNSNVSEQCYVSALMSEPLPLHGIHYWELKIKSPNNS